MEDKVVVISRKTRSPTIITAFDPDANKILRSDIKARHENRKPTSLSVNRFYEKGGSEGVSPDPAHVGLVNRLPDAGASKVANATQNQEEVKV